MVGRKVPVKRISRKLSDIEADRKSNKSDFEISKPGAIPKTPIKSPRGAQENISITTATSPNSAKAEQSDPPGQARKAKRRKKPANRKVNKSDFQTGKVDSSSVSKLDGLISRIREETRTKKPTTPVGSQAWFEYLENSSNLKMPPGVKFKPTPEERAALVRMLERKDSDKKKRKLLERLGDGFLLYYSRYRRRLQPSYVCVGKERKHAQVAGALCVMKSTTPAHLIAYWAEHVSDFTSLKFPPLTFLASPGNVDRAACESIEGKRSKANGPRSETHAYSDLGGLDSKLRPALEDAGFDLSGIDDRYLLTVQSAAQTVAKGVPLFVSGKLKPMVHWAARNLYGGDNAERGRGS